MKLQMLILVFLVVAACAVQEENEDSMNGVHLCAANERNVACTREYMPVCGSKSGVQQTYGNDCSACSDPSVISYEQGECEETTGNTPNGLSECPEDLRGAEICTMDYTPVCVEYADGRRETAGNLCMGCSQEEVVGYTQGECEEEQLPDIGEEPVPVEMTMCDVENRPQACTREYRAVCGAVDTGIRCITAPCPSVEYETFSTDCTACAEDNVMGHYPGSCEEQKFVVCGEGSKTGFDPTEHAARIGGICVDSCPNGFDSYMTQIGVEMCIVHYGEEEIASMPTCTKSSESCECVKAYETTSGEEIANAQYHCVPEQYASRMLFRGGLDRLDENGEQGVMIA